MILRRDVLNRILDGSVTVAFRRWRRPSVQAGGTLLTSHGQLHISCVAIVPESAITEDDARGAGCASLEDLLRDLDWRKEGAIYRIEFAGMTPDPRVRIRESLPDGSELTAILNKLNQLDARSADGPWTRTVLELIASEPGVLAGILARRTGMEKLAFKSRVRKLKALGLTISLGTGYRLSPRGEAVMTFIAPA